MRPPSLLGAAASFIGWGQLSPSVLGGRFEKQGCQEAARATASLGIQGPGAVFLWDGGWLGARSMVGTQSVPALKWYPWCVSPLFTAPRAPALCARLLPMSVRGILAASGSSGFLFAKHLSELGLP